MKGISTALLVCALGCVTEGPAAEASIETIVYSFCSQANCADGWYPEAGVISVRGTLYGTTRWGGETSCGMGCGTVFSLKPKTGAETVLHLFNYNGPDGVNPTAGLINIKGTLYGTTLWGGASGYGTVFSLNAKTGTETVLHSFQGAGTDGENPAAGLTNVKGTFYGTTDKGGTGTCKDGCGTVFSFNVETGAETALYSFQDNGTDGTNPAAGLINVSGVLYGTTKKGGTGSCTGGCGTVFSVDPTSGAEIVLHSFQGAGTDGANPEAGLINVNGTLYGTTKEGGTGSCKDGCGTVFSLDLTSGAESVPYFFQGNATDGSDPLAGLMNVNGTLYGTTYIGGAYGSGTVFSLNLQSGTEAVLYSFGSGTDAANPAAGLINVKGTLYGTTENGGANDEGTVFSLVP